MILKRIIRFTIIDFTRCHILKLNASNLISAGKHKPLSQILYLDFMGSLGGEGKKQCKLRKKERNNG